jgi:hypothetical protein
MFGSTESAKPLQMPDAPSDAAHLRELAEKCRRIAFNLTDETDAASLRQMAAEYDALASRIDHHQGLVHMRLVNPLT